jgi:hypothetical protein
LSFFRENCIRGTLFPVLLPDSSRRSGCQANSLSTFDENFSIRKFRRSISQVFEGFVCHTEK